MAADFYLKTMGYPELYSSDGKQISVRVRKHLALLVYFTIEARTHHRREKLIDLLWSGVPLAKGRHSLSMALTVIRALVGREAVRCSAHGVRVKAGSIELDIDLLQNGDLTSPIGGGSLEVAAFLSEFDLPDAPAFQEWRAQQHMRLLHAIKSGLLALIEQARRSGRMSEVMRLADRLLGLDPLSEEGTRARMEAFALQGDRLTALRVFEEYRETLLRELGAAPSEVLVNIAARLRRRGVGPLPAGAPAVPTDHWADRSFVGRAKEYRLLSDSWESTRQLRTRHVLVTGDTGIGKSTLALRFGTAAALEGAAVARVQCFEMEQRIPFGMIGALVTSLLDRPGAVATAPAALAEIARVVPRVRERFPNLPAPRNTEGESARLQFAEGTFALLEAVMEEQPLLLIIDDYPRSDEVSLSILHMLLRRMTDKPLMVILTGRPPDTGEPEQSRRIRKALTYLPMEALDLAPLKDEEGEELLAKVLASESRSPSLQERRAILAAAGGNPMAVELLARDWATHGYAAMAISLPAMWSEVPAAAFGASRYDEMLRRLLPDLAPRTRAALYLATILGPRLNDLDFFQLVGLSAAQAIVAMNDLVDRRLLRDAGRDLEFVNELVRARVYLQIPGSLRIRLHGGISDRLLVRLASGKSVQGLEIAWHCIRARRRDEAIPHLIAGARGAIASGAPDEAARALSSALPQLRGTAKTDAALLLVETYQEMAQWADALKQIAELKHQASSTEEDKTLLGIYEIQCRAYLGAFTAEEQRDQIPQLLSYAGSNQPSVTRATAAATAAYLAGNIKDARLCLWMYTSLLDKPVDELPALDRSRFLLARAQMLYHARDLETVKSELEGVARILEESKAINSTFVRLNTGLGAIAAAQGHYADALEPLEKAYAAASRIDNAYFMSQAAYNQSMCYWTMGADDESMKWIDIARRTSLSLPKGEYERVSSAAHYGFSCIDRNKEGVERSLEWLEDEIRLSMYPWVVQSAELFRADLSWLIGRKRIALVAATRARAISSTALSLGSTGILARWSTRLLLERGRPDLAQKELDETFTNFDRLDAKDRLEILLAKKMTYLSLAMPIKEIDEQIEKWKGILPPRLASVMAKLGYH